MARTLPFSVRLPLCMFSSHPVKAERPADRETSGGYGAGAHLFPFRTEKLSPAATMILRETVEK